MPTGTIINNESRAPAQRRSRKATLYRFLRQVHLVVAIVTAAPLVVASLTGTLLVFGHELEHLIRPAVTIQPQTGPTLPYAELLSRVAAQRPDAKVWAVNPMPETTQPWRMWLQGGKEIFEVDPWSGVIVEAYHPEDTPYNIVRALHRRWLVNDKPGSDWTRTIISITALAMMVQVLAGVWMWAIPAKRLQRLKPLRGRNRRLVWQRLHMTCGVVTAALLLAVAFTGLSMYWTDTTRILVDWSLPGHVEQPSNPSTRGLKPVTSIDDAVTMAHRLIPDATVASVRPPNKPGGFVHVGLQTPDTGVNSRVWLGDAPLRVLQFYDGRQASAASRFWHFRYWLHIGGFGGVPVQILWLVLSLMPLGFVISGLWLWRNRRRDRQRP